MTSIDRGQTAEDRVCRMSSLRFQTFHGRPSFAGMAGLPSQTDRTDGKCLKRWDGKPADDRPPRGRDLYTAPLQGNSLDRSLSASLCLSLSPSLFASLSIVSMFQKTWRATRRAPRGQKLHTDRLAELVHHKAPRPITALSSECSCDFLLRTAACDNNILLRPLMEQLFALRNLCCVHASLLASSPPGQQACQALTPLTSLPRSHPYNLS